MCNFEFGARLTLGVRPTLQAFPFVRRSRARVRVWMMWIDRLTGTPEVGLNNANDHSWKHYAGPLLVLLVGIWALTKAWALGPDIHVDFGRELYVPWRISEGEGLYRDIAYFNGPLSVYWHALWFSLVGASLATLKWLNLATVVIASALIFQIADRISGRFAATVVTAFFVGAIAFGQLQPIGNYDYLTPYSHELIHGIVLSLFALYEFLRRDERSASSTSARRCGAILGLVFLTKVEAFFALAAALAIGFAFDAMARDKPVEALRRSLGALGLAFIGVLFVALCALSLDVGIKGAALGMIEPIRAVIGSDVASLEFYSWVMGTLDLANSLGRIGLGLLVYAGLFTAIVGLGFGVQRLQLDRFALVIGGACVIAAVAVPLAPAQAVNSIRPLAVLTPMLLGVLAVRFISSRDKSLIAPICIVAFGFALQFKMLFNSQFGHYGFALLMPSALVFVAVIVDVLPRMVEGRGGSGPVVRFAVCGALLAVAIGMNARSDGNFVNRTVAVGSGSDAMLSDFRAQRVVGALKFLEAKPPGTSVAVLPEGIMFNYLSRRVNPTRYINFMPPEMNLYGEATIIDAFRAQPPDYLIFAHKRTAEYGAAYFGRDYGRDLYDWATSNYREIMSLGGTPFERGTRFGMTILERRIPESE